MSSHKIFFSLLCATFLFATSHASAETDNGYADALVASAEKAGLWEDRYWRLLMHYQDGIISGSKSEIYDPTFYNSPGGVNNPRAELEATIRAFFRPADGLREGEEHPQCNFPARLKWLKAKLEIDPSRLPTPNCERLDQWRASLGVNRVTLVFASYYMASPASMFGHTLLRLDKEREGQGMDLMNYGVNYAAKMDTENPVLMASKGILGLFDGTVTTFPYYMKVQEYGNMEARDLWEYQLSLTRDQVDSLVLHLWEVGNVRFHYYYFRENCAYELLALIEVGNPELHLTEHFPIATVPSETVKALYLEKGLVAKRIYRPSLTTKLNERRENMDDEQKRAFKELVGGKEFSDSQAYADLNEHEKADVLDAYLEYRQYVVMRTSKKENEGLIKQSRKALLERSRLASNAADATAPSSARGPEEGHASNKAVLGFGGNNAGPFEQISYRPTYHDLLSSGAGYAENSQIIYFDMSSRVYNQTGRTVFEGIKLVDLVTISPYDPLYGGTSWSVGFGFRNLRDIGCEECQAFYVNFGDGYAVRAQILGSAVFYAMLKFEGALGGKLEKGYRLGAGPDIGVLIEEAPAWKTNFYARGARYPVGDVSTDYEYGVSQRFAITKELELTATIARVKDDNEAMISIAAYF
jgi:hypothetical protein